MPIKSSTAVKTFTPVIRNQNEPACAPIANCFRMNIPSIQLGYGSHWAKWDERVGEEFHCAKDIGSAAKIVMEDNRPFVIKWMAENHLV
jgi:hypothetical protein